MSLPTPQVHRRTVLAGAGAVGAATALSASLPAEAATAGRKVVILGGGMAGLTAAHELIERGFEVTVYEPTAWGGKARSMPVPGTAAGGRKALPGEHGFRFFPGFYHHIPDTMRRIPDGTNAQGVYDNLVAAQGGAFLRADGRADAGPFGLGPDPFQVGNVDNMRQWLQENFAGQGVPPHEVAYFVERLLVFLTSSDARRFGQWENVSWWDFVGAETRSPEYQKICAAGLTRNLVAAKETLASTRTIGNMGEAFVYTIMGRGNDGALDRVLDLPTNEAWIAPWVRHLTSLGVKFVHGKRLAAYEMGNGRVTAVQLADKAGTRTRVTADWFISAMPVEQARKYMNSAMVAKDPQLGRMKELLTDWMVGIQFYLRRTIDVTSGHITFIDSPWALTALCQAQFWTERDFAATYGDGSVVDCLSVDISNWDAPGILYGKPAKECTRQEIAREVLAQIREHDTVGSQLTGDIIHSWFLDPAIAWDPAKGRNTNETPLLVNTVGSWVKRPKAKTKIPNFFLAGDFVQTDIDLATMEGANESARAATIALLDAAGSTAPRPKMFKLLDPPEFEALKVADAALYAAGLPNALDTEGLGGLLGVDLL